MKREANLWIAQQVVAPSVVVRRGLIELGSDLINAVECDRMMKRRSGVHTRAIVGEIRSALTGLSAHYRPDVLECLRLGVQIHRERNSRLASKAGKC